MGNNKNDKESKRIEKELTVERIRFLGDGGFVIASATDGYCTIGVKGYTPELVVGRTYSFEGTVENTKYGPTLNFEVANELLPKTEDAILDYLSSGYVKGIGPAMAERIVKAFGDATFAIFSNSPERLLEISGIGPAVYKRIISSWEDQRKIQKIMQFLNGCGFTYVMASKVYASLGHDAEKKIREDPYCLARSVDGIGFIRADAIAARLGITGSDPRRILAGIEYTLSELTNEGHVYCERNELAGRTAELIGVQKEAVQDSITEAENIRIVINDRGNIYLRRLFFAEMSAAKELKRIASADLPQVSVTDADICRLEHRYAITYDDFQKDVIRQITGSGVSVITGGPGTGKTTVLRAVIDLFEKAHLSIALAAPTGRAAKRMQESTDRMAFTIHRLLAHTQTGFMKNASDPLEEDVIVIDEASMIDIELFASIAQAVRSGARLVLVGDVDQLPPVGPGNVLRDIIASGAIPVHKLRLIHRQSADSGIVVNACRINAGFTPSFSNESEDFQFVEVKPDAEGDISAPTAEAVTDLVERLVKNGASSTDIQVLCPMKKTEAGVNVMNSRLQSIFTFPTKNAFPFREDDKIMQMKNNYESDIYNGDIGIVRQVDARNWSLIADFDGRLVEFDRAMLSDVQLAYACTVHKSQGSEYRYVIVPVIEPFFMMLKRNLLYTAVTRAKKQIFLVGTKKAVAIAVKNDAVAARHTLLAERLK